MSLNPQARKLPSGKIELTWTPDPTAFGYRFYRDGTAVSKSTNPAQHTTTFAAETDGKPHYYGVALAYTQESESVQFPAVTPPPSNLPVGTLPEMMYPRNPGAIGTSLDPRANADFQEMEYDGWGAKNLGGRLTYAANPFGSGTVVKASVFFGDSAQDRWDDDGQRVEQWRYPAENKPGTSGWWAFSIGLGDGVKGELHKYASSWNVCPFQHHDGQGSPPQELGITGKRFVWTCRTSGGDYSASNKHDIAPATLGHMHHFLNYTEFSLTKGRVMLWHAIDTQPDPASPPNDDRALKTLYGNNLGLTTLTSYRDPSSNPADYPWTVFQGKFARAKTAARALELAR